ncbi:hypothetical protein RFI_20556, partial [Reticulomyxa filosa]
MGRHKTADKLSLPKDSNADLKASDDAKEPKSNSNDNDITSEKKNSEEKTTSKKTKNECINFDLTWSDDPSNEHQTKQMSSEQKEIEEKKGGKEWEQQYVRKKETYQQFVPSLKHVLHALTSYGVLLNFFEQILLETDNANAKQERIDIMNQYGCFASCLWKLLCILRFAN